jgi:hypothetical protein
MLLRASEVAYGQGVTGLVECAGPAAGLTRLAGIEVEELTGADDGVHIALRWNAIAPDGKLCTVLLGDLMLLPAGKKLTVLSLTGTYWLPGEAGAAVDRAVVRCCAMTAIGGFLDSLACMLGHPSGTAGPAGRDLVP